MGTRTRKGKEGEKMIRAKFVKAFVTEEGITYTLKGEKSKDVLRAAVDLQDENCIIELAEGRTIEPAENELKNLVEMIQYYGRCKFEEGAEKGQQGTIAELDEQKR